MDYPFTPYPIEPMTLEAKLNNLIQLGWKPRGDIPKGFDGITVEGKSIYINNNITRSSGLPISLNDLCSIDSGLRAFVCEKGLYEEQALENYRINMGVAPLTDHRKPEYRLMLSSIQEDKEKFLLDNIVLPTT